MVNRQNRFKLSQNDEILNFIEVVVEGFLLMKDDINEENHMSGASYI